MQLEGTTAGDFLIGAFNLKSLELEPKTVGKGKGQRRLLGKEQYSLPLWITCALSSSSVTAAENFPPGVKELNVGCKALCCLWMHRATNN